MTEPLARHIEGTTALVTGANRGLGKALGTNASPALIVVTGDDLWRLDDKIRQPLEHVFGRTLAEVGDELVVDRKVWGKDEEVTNTLGLMKVGNERPH